MSLCTLHFPVEVKLIRYTPIYLKNKKEHEMPVTNLMSITKSYE